MELFHWQYNGIEYNTDPFKLIPIQNDPFYGRPLHEAIGMSLEEAQQIKQDSKWFYVRQKRDELLAATDWVAGEDVPQNIKDVYFPYRQSLRDITNQSDVDNITWPNKPE